MVKTQIVQGDITKIHVDVIVNAANATLLGLNQLLFRQFPLELTDIQKTMLHKLL